MAVDPSLRHLADTQSLLERRILALQGDPRQVLEVGEAVLAFASSEEDAFLPLLGLMDPAARGELTQEHDRLAHDLELLRWLVDTVPDSPDVGILADALTRRMREHIARDGRLLTQAHRLRQTATTRP